MDPTGRPEVTGLSRIAKDTFTMHASKLIFRRTAFFCCAMICGALSIIPSPAQAQTQNIVFSIDPTSTESISGTDPSGVPFTQQASGSLSSTVSGGFTVAFDPTTDLTSAVSTTIQFPSATTGYFQLSSSNTTGNPGIAGSSTPAPANFDAQGTGGFSFAWRDIGWNFHSNAAMPSTSISGGVASFDAHGADTTHASLFNVNNANFDLNNQTTSPPSGFVNANYAGSLNNRVDSGAGWQLSEPSAGVYSLHFTGNYTYGYSGNGNSAQSIVFHSDITATAHFSAAANIAAVPPQNNSTPTTVVVTAGAPNASAPGAVALTLPPTNTSNVTSVSVQQIPITGITQAAVNAAQSIPVFAAALSNAAAGQPNAQVQVWEVNPAGFLNDGSQTATLVFNYDPTLFPGVDPSQLGIWHFNTLTSHWDFGGTVDPVAHTITYTTHSFSDFIFAPVPEPSTFVLAGASLAALGYLGWRRRR
jgi:hypothetical protein